MNYTAKQLALSYKERSKDSLSEMILLGKILALSSTKKLFGNPKISIEQKKKIVDDVFANNFDNKSTNFIKFLIDTDSLNKFDIILNEYRKILRVDNIALSGTVTSANLISPEEMIKLENDLENKMSVPVVLQNKVNSTLLGGVILEIDGSVYNNSFSHKLSKLR